MRRGEGQRGIVTLANDAVLDALIALCESLRQHDPVLAVTVIPFDERVSRTRPVVAEYGHHLLAGASLAAMDALGRRYWPGETFKPHVMRKFCAWVTYDTFLFLDADVVVLGAVDPYFDAFDASGADFMHFAPGIEQVYEPGAVRQRMLPEHHTAGFNSGVFMSRRNALTLPSLESFMESARPLRGAFVDNLEQTFMNYCVDVGGLRSVDANELVDDVVVAGALMRCKRSPEGLVLRDRRVPQSGRRVSMVHWAGYAIGPFMPYRRIFLSYRLAPDATFGNRLRRDVADIARLARHASARRAYHVARQWPYRARSWLAARGLVSWPY
jgi:hypothetical protein